MPAPPTLDVVVNWSASVTVTRTVATVEVDVMPFLGRTSHGGPFAAYQRAMSQLGASYVRFAPWTPNPRVTVPELSPPDCTATRPASPSPPHSSRRTRTCSTSGHRRAARPAPTAATAGREEPRCSAQAPTPPSPAMPPCLERRTHTGPSAAPHWGRRTPCKHHRSSQPPTAPAPPPSRPRKPPTPPCTP